MHVFKRRARRARARQKLRAATRAWAGIGAKVTFRAEVMPGREPEERTFTVARVVANGRVELAGLAGEHAETEFEADSARATGLIGRGGEDGKSERQQGAEKQS